MSEQKLPIDYVPASVAMAQVFKAFWGRVDKEVLQRQPGYDLDALRLVREVAEAAFHVGVGVGKALELVQPEQKEGEGD